MSLHLHNSTALDPILRQEVDHYLIESCCVMVKVQYMTCSGLYIGLEICGFIEDPYSRFAQRVHAVAGPRS